MEKVKLLDKTFRPYIKEAEILEKIDILAKRMSDELRGRDVFFLGILNGSFMFASDLLKRVDIDCRVTFLKLASYSGTSSTGNVKRLIGINEDIKGHTVVILEDIVDTGLTLEHIFKQLQGYEPDEIKVATMFLKPDAYKGKQPVDYVGMEIPNDFIVGYGLDYDGYGRNLRDLYVLDD